MPTLEFSVSFVFLILFFLCLVKYNSRISALFSLTCFSITINTFGFGLELLAKTLKQIQFSLDVQFLGIVFIPSLMILISYEFYFHKLTPFADKFIILLIPVVMLFVFLTNSFHHLYYYKLIIEEDHGFLTTHFIKGPGNYFFISYAYLGLLFSFIVFFKKWKEASYSIKTQALWMFIGNLCSSITYLIYIFDFSHNHYNLITFGFAFLAVCWYIAVFKYDFLDLSHIARDLVIDEIHEGIMVLDPKDRIIDFNHAGKKMLNWLNRNCIGQDLRSYPEGMAINKKASIQFTMEVIRNQQKKCLHFTMVPIIQKNKPVGKIFIFQDITEQTAVLEKLHNMAAIDSLTEIYNRRKLMEEAEKEFYRTYRYGTNLSALMVDIDLFKNVNDTYGHLAGDKVIKSIAQECKQRLRKSDIIGRYGGEEFLLLLVQTNLQEALSVAEDIRNLIETTGIEFEDQIIHVQVSIGAASTSSHSEKITLYDLINESDKALYHAKNTGRNRVCTIANPKEL